MVDIFEPNFTTGDLENASGVLKDTIHKWFKRGVLTIGLKDKDSAGQGMARRFGAATAVHVAIMGALIRQGMDPRRAEMAGKIFVYTGDEHRDPCKLFPMGDTWLAMCEDRSGVYHIDTEGERSLASMVSDIRQGVTDPAAVVLLNLEDVVMRVAVSLRLEWEAFHTQDSGKPTGYASVRRE